MRASGLLGAAIILLGAARAAAQDISASLWVVEADFQARLEMIGGLPPMGLNPEADSLAARALHDQALKMNRDLGSQQQEMVLLRDLGVDHADQGAYDRAEQCFLKSMELGRSLDDRSGVEDLPVAKQQV